MVQANPEAMRHATKAALPKDREKKQTWSLEGGDPDKGSASADADVKALKDKLREANSRLNHQTVQAEKAKQELASVKRALAKEVGDGVDVKKVIAEGGGWRGRAQQISMLKDKLRESKRALDAHLGPGRRAHAHHGRDAGAGAGQRRARAGSGLCHRPEEPQAHLRARAERAARE